MHPRLFQIGHWVLPTYGLFVAVATLLALLVCLRTARLLALDHDKVWSVALLAVAVTVVGSRILFVLLRGPRYSFAAIAVAAAGGALYALRLGLPLRRTADAFAPSLALGSSVVSIGCLEAGCDYGTPTRLPWAVVFRSRSALSGAPVGVPLHPTQLYASAAEFVFFVALLWLLHRPHQDGEILGAWFFLAGLANFFLAFLRGDLTPLHSGLLTGTQLVAAAMVLAGGLLWLHRPQTVQVAHGG